MSDTEMLDWLQNHSATVYRNLTGGERYFVVVDESKKERRGCLGTTLRKAIEEAAK